MKNILVYGLGKSGVSSAQLLMKQGYRVFLYDGKQHISQEVLQLAKDGAILLDDLLDDLISKLSMAVVSPGVSVYCDDVQRLKQKTKVIGETELGFFNCRGQVVSITGTNGKTTTCSLVDYILHISNKKSYLLGNVGVPFTTAVQDIQKDDIVVLETSSFQLETTEIFKPYIGALLNVTPDHLDRHFDKQTYIDTKLKLFAKQDENCFAVLCADDKTVVAKADKIKSQKIWFGCDSKADVYAKDNAVYFCENKIADLKNATLKGKHNLSNMLCAIAICKLLEVDDSFIQQGIDTFVPVQHRMQKVGYIGDVLFVNDSKATNAEAALPALSAFDNVAAILGGSDKGCDFDVLFANIPANVRYCVFYGEVQNKLAQSAQRQDFCNYFFADSFDNAVKIAYHSIYPNGTVLLSPACASFDCFANFEERGKRFCNLFLELKNEKR